MQIVYLALVGLNIYLCGLLIGRDIERKNPQFFFWFVLLIIFFIPSLFDFNLSDTQGNIYSVNYELESQTLFIAQFISLISILTLYILDRVFGGSYKYPDFKVAVKVVNRFDIYWALILILSSMAVFYELVEKYSLTFYQSFSFEDRREGLSFLSKFLLSYNLKVCSGLVLLLFLIKKKSWAFLLSLYYLGLFLVLGGTRQPLFALILPFIALLVFNQKRPLISIFVLVILSNIMLLVAEALIILRYTSSVEDKINLLVNFSDLYLQASSGSGESDLRLAYYYFVQNIHNLDGFSEFSYLFRTLLFWLPSSLDVFNLKPPDFEYAMFYHYTEGMDGTMHPIFFGTVYADAGILFIFWIILYFLITRILNIALAKFSGVNYILFWAVLASTYVMFARGSIYGPIVIVLFSFLYLSLGRYVFSLFKIVLKV